MELMITIMLAAILVSFVVPSFRGLVETARYNSNSDSLVEAFRLARNEAIFNGKRIVVCAMADESATEPVCSANQLSWNGGWMVYQDCDNNLQRDTLNLICDLNNDGINDSVESQIKIFQSPKIDVQTDAGSALQFHPSGNADPITVFTLSKDGVPGSELGTVTLGLLAQITTKPAN